MTEKKAPVRAPRAIRVRDNLGPGEALRLSPEALRAFARLFGGQVLEQLEARRRARD